MDEVMSSHFEALLAARVKGVKCLVLNADSKVVEKSQTLILKY